MYLPVAGLSYTEKVGGFNESPLRTWQVNTKSAQQ